MENKSMGKISVDNDVEIYSITAMSDCGETLESFVTLDRKLAVEKALDIYDDYNQQNVFIDIWKNNTVIKTGYIIDGELIEEKF